MHHTTHISRTFRQPRRRTTAQARPSSHTRSRQGNQFRFHSQNQRGNTGPTRACMRQRKWCCGSSSPPRQCRTCRRRIVRPWTRRNPPGSSNRRSHTPAAVSGRRVTTGTTTEKSQYELGAEDHYTIEPTWQLTQHTTSTPLAAQTVAFAPHTALTKQALNSVAEMTRVIRSNSHATHLRSATRAREPRRARGSDGRG